MNEPTFIFRGGDEALDFCNTWSVDAKDRLADYGTLVAWARQRGVIGTAEARRLVADAAAHPDLARAVHRDALALRDALFRIFTARASESPPARADLLTLNAWLPRALARLRLSSSGDSWEWAADDVGAAA